MIDRLHVAGDQGGLWRGLIHGGDILLAHDDGTQPRHLGIAAVEDDDLGLVPLQRLFNLGVPDGVTRQIEGLLCGMGEDHPGYLTQPLGQHRHDLIVAVLPLGLVQADAGKFGLLAQQAHILEAAGADAVGILLVLYKQREMLGQQLLRGRVPVIQVIVGDYHRIHIEDLRHGQG
ncbi:hypothetical protein D3C72_1540050 [compost metagenome]